MVDLSVELAGVRLRNPVVAAAGTCGYVEELADVLDTAVLGAVVTKSFEPNSIIAGVPAVKLRER